MAIRLYPKLRPEDAGMLVTYRHPELLNDPDIDPLTGLPLPAPFAPEGNMQDYIYQSSRQLKNETLAGGIKGSGYGFLRYATRGPLLNPFGGASIRIPTRIGVGFAESIYGGLVKRQFGSGVGSGAAWRKSKPLGRTLDVLIPGSKGLFGRTGLKSFLAWNALTGNPDNLSTMSDADVVGAYLPFAGMSSIRNHLTNRLMKGDKALSWIGELSGAWDKNIASTRGNKAAYKNMLNNMANTADINNIKYGSNLRRAGLMNELNKIEEGRSWSVGKSHMSETSKPLSQLKSKLENLKINTRVTGAAGAIESATVEAELFKMEEEFRNLKSVSLSGGVRGRIKTLMSNALHPVEAAKSLAARSVTNSGLDLFTQKAVGFGGKALRFGLNLQIGMAVADVASSYAKHKVRIAGEIARSIPVYETAYKGVEGFMSDGTERQRAIEAIQNSSMSLRNFIGQEATLMH